VANIIRDIIPLAYSVIQQNLSDAIEYKRGAAAYVVTTATPVPTLGAVEYLVNQVDSNDYEGYILVVIKK
jgi:hypothetical protein